MKGVKDGVGTADINDQYGDPDVIEESLEPAEDGAENDGNDTPNGGF